MSQHLSRREILSSTLVVNHTLRLIFSPRIFTEVLKLIGVMRPIKTFQFDSVPTIDPFFSVQEVVKSVKNSRNESWVKKFQTSANFSS